MVVRDTAAWALATHTSWWKGRETVEETGWCFQSLAGCSLVPAPRPPPTFCGAVRSQGHAAWGSRVSTLGWVPLGWVPLGWVPLGSRSVGCAVEQDFPEDANIPVCAAGVSHSKLVSGGLTY